MHIFSFTSSTSDLVLKEVIRLSIIEADKLGFERASLDAIKKYTSHSQANDSKDNDMLD